MNKLLLCGAAMVLTLQGCAGEAPKSPEKAADVSHCVRDTGTRIEHPGCTGAPGRSYSHDEIERTGATSTGEALQQLDPAVRPR